MEHETLNHSPYSRNGTAGFVLGHQTESRRTFRNSGRYWREHHQGKKILFHHVQSASRHHSACGYKLHVNQKVKIFTNCTTINEQLYPTNCQQSKHGPDE